MQVVKDFFTQWKWCNTHQYTASQIQTVNQACIFNSEHDQALEQTTVGSDDSHALFPSRKD